MLATLGDVLTLGGDWLGAEDALQQAARTPGFEERAASGLARVYARLGRYRDMASLREVVYVEEKGPQCASAAHRQNHTISALRDGRTADGFQPALAAIRAS